MEITKLTLSHMSNSQKVAALLIILGPSTATEVLKNIPDDELIEQITLDIASLNKVPKETLDEILEEFHSLFQASNYLSRGGMDYAKKLLEQAYGGDRAEQILDKLMATLHTNPFQFFNDADPGQLATSFQNENPQLVALVLAYLKPDKAAAVLNSLPPQLQSLVAMRIAEMDRTNPEILSEIEKIIESKFSSVVSQDFSKAGGVDALANILNRSDRTTEKKIMETLESYDGELAERVRELMFVFEDIVKLDDRSIQRILREVETKDLAMALKGSNQEVKEKIYKNMSERASAMLKDDMEYMGPVRAREVQECQTKIVSTIRALETTGEIVLSRDVEDDFIE
ncbi:MAG: flagellar motor switch protein FliG [Candidatus Melainabacteria bacterium RIFOXYA12_FULL_32_12]|nr:MAG: flagellar motor switch protein FliG [Candidatus Melainabacteria bacterium GWF2_32_7]OGI23039.1 MAG: flagellar motor switch protein FliG [Candidatus Melainabacteria bacterium RIFOXYA2_FULL_32_9]OGI31375.1 MAG: flagellar motor switch protein FliG [Candidatus Melainabacteria bacterium RIFOXYA12_FULL_32_12]